MPIKRNAKVIMVARGLVIGFFLISGVSFVVSGEKGSTNFSTYYADARTMSEEAVITKLTRYSDPDAEYLELRGRFDSYPTRITIPTLVKVFNESSNMIHKARAFGFLQYSEEKGGNVSYSLDIARNLLPSLSDSNYHMTLKLECIKCVSTYGDAHDIQLIQDCTNSAQLVVRTIASRELKKLEVRLAAAKTNTIPIPVPVQSVTNATVNSTNPTNLDRVPNVVPSTTTEKTAGQSVVFKWTSIVTFVIAALGVLFVFFKRWRKR